ncbi:hypothetical protein ONZ45_g13664 [Pleurotus djamor]|nr:hypothetical protein ONZ45_g13664 [Pleurotus djamor]
MDHIFEHDGQPVPDLSSVSGSASSATSGPAADDEDDEDADALRSLGVKVVAPDVGAEAKAWMFLIYRRGDRLMTCGKIFKNTALVNFHAEKSGHDQFEESTEEVKPLTEEEKKQKLAELREKMAAKRATKAVEDEKEARANEAIRRKSGKDLEKAKQELKEKQVIKEAEERRRDKIEDAKARAAVKAQIEADKKARADKAAREKALREGRDLPSDASTSATPPSRPAASAPSGVAGKDFKETRLQIRMASGGQPYTTTLSSDAPLREVAEFLAGQTLAVDVETVSFAQHFPRYPLIL